MNTGMDNIYTGISKITQKFDNREFEEKYIKRTIGNQIIFSKTISLILFFTFDIFLLVVITIDSQYSNSKKVILASNINLDQFHLFLGYLDSHHLHSFDFNSFKVEI